MDSFVSWWVQTKEISLPELDELRIGHLTTVGSEYSSGLAGYDKKLCVTNCLEYCWSHFLNPLERQPWCQYFPACAFLLALIAISQMWCLWISPCDRRLQKLSFEVRGTLSLFKEFKASDFFSAQKIRYNKSPSSFYLFVSVWVFVNFRRPWQIKYS